MPERGDGKEDHEMTGDSKDPQKWFAQGKQLPTLDKQYNYFSEGFRKGESYHPWAWAGVGLVWLQKGNLESAIDAFEKALALNPELPGIVQQLQLARAKAGGQPSPVPEIAPARQSATDIPPSSSLTSETSPNQLELPFSVKKFSESPFSITLRANSDFEKKIRDFTPVILKEFREKIKSGEIDPVIEVNAKCLCLDPTDDHAWDGLGIAFETASKLPEALFCYYNIRPNAPFEENGKRVRNLELKGIIAKIPTVVEKYKIPSVNHYEIKAEGEVVITATAYEHLCEFSNQGASHQIPPDQWRMSIGVFVCRAWENTLRVEDAVGLAHGTITEVKTPPEGYDKLARLEEQIRQQGRFLGGSFFTRPGKGTTLLGTSVLNLQASHQRTHPLAVTLVFDHTKITPSSLGFRLHRLYEPLKSRFYEVDDFSHEGLTQESFAEAIRPFVVESFPIGRLFDAIKERFSNVTPPPVLKCFGPRAGDFPEKDRAYYRQAWGFDPVKDWATDIVNDKEVYFYEEVFELTNDPALDAAGVKFIARVEVDAEGESHNRLGFLRENEIVFIECIHTAIYDGTPEEIANLSPEDYEAMVTSTEGRPAILPPWEHFASLKSFAAGLVDRGIVATLFGAPPVSPSKGIFEDLDMEVPEWGENGINDQLINVLDEVAPEIVKHQVMKRAGDIIEQAPEDWIKTHSEPLFLRYKIEQLITDTAYLASVDNTTLKKLLILFLNALHEDFYEVIEVGEQLLEKMHKSVETFLGYLCEGNFLEELDPELVHQLVDAISNEIGPPRTPLESKIRGKILSILPRTPFADPHPLSIEFRAWFKSMDKSPRQIYKEYYETEDIQKKLAKKHLDEPALIAGFRHSNIFDTAQYNIFGNPKNFAQAQVLAPTLPWEQLHLEWKAREAAEHEEFGRDIEARGEGSSYSTATMPAAEIWPRGHFCCYEFPRVLLDPCAGREVPLNTRRERVLRYINEVLRRYDRSGKKRILMVKDLPLHELDLEVDEVIMLGWATRALDEVEVNLLKPFPANLVKPVGPRIQSPNDNPPKGSWYVHQPPESYLPTGFTLADVTDRVRHGIDYLRRAITLTLPLPVQLQVELATHWDFATRLALIGNSQTDAAVIATLSQDPQPCVRAAASARQRRGETKIEPLIGEVLDPGEIIWLLAAYPSVLFNFGVTTWDRGDGAYRRWLQTRLRKDEGLDEWGMKDVKGIGLAWAYEDGFIYEDQPDYERGRKVSHLALNGLESYACGHYPCIYLGPSGWCCDGTMNVPDGKGGWEKVDSVERI